MAYAYFDKNSEDTKFYKPPYVPQKPPVGTTGSNTGATGSTTSNTSSTGGTYDRLLRQQQQQRQQDAERERRARQQAIDKQAGYQSGQARDAAAGSRTNEYIYNEMANRDMGQQASLMGLGGLSESSLTGQRANYQSNLSGIDRNLNTELGSIENQRAQGALGADKDYNTILRQLSQDRAQSELQSMARQQASAASQQSEKPRMTYTQYADAIKNGYTGSSVDQAKGYYGELIVPKTGGAPAASSSSGSTGNAPAAISQYTDYYDSIIGNMPQAERKPYLAKIIQQMMNNGVDSATAQQLANYYGYS